MASPVVLALSVSGEVEGARHHADVHQVVHDPGLDVALVLVHHHLQSSLLSAKHTYMSQMLYAGQSDREDVTFFSDF